MDTSDKRKKVLLHQNPVNRVKDQSKEMFYMGLLFLKLWNLSKEFEAMMALRSSLQKIRWNYTSLSEPQVENFFQRLEIFFKLEGKRFVWAIRRLPASRTREGKFGVLR